MGPLCGFGVAAAGLPVVPRAEVHHRFGVEHRDLVVVGELRRDLRHRRRIGRIERRPVGLRVLGVAGRDRRNQRLLARARLGGEPARLLGGREGRRHRVFLHRQVDVGPEHQRFAPEAHRAVGIELLRLAEGALRLVVIERVGEPESLVEIGLRLLVRGRDLVRHRAEPLPQRRIGVGESGRRHGGLHSRRAAPPCGPGPGASWRRWRRARPTRDRWGRWRRTADRWPWRCLSRRSGRCRRRTVQAGRPAPQWRR